MTTGQNSGDFYNITKVVHIRAKPELRSSSSLLPTSDQNKYPISLIPNCITGNIKVSPPFHTPLSPLPKRKMYAD